MAVTGISTMPTTIAAEISDYFGVPRTWPKDGLRLTSAVPPGTGYVPHGADPPNIYEAAALQERARADHQRVLTEIVDRVHQLGGTCRYNNNIDLLAQIGNERLLIEAKSINKSADAVHRMRYGMGQLFDYHVRYRAEIENAKPMLAFGRIPSRDTSWIADVLQENGVAFVASVEGAVMPLNELGKASHLFTS